MRTLLIKSFMLSILLIGLNACSGNDNIIAFDNHRGLWDSNELNTYEYTQRDICGECPENADREKRILVVDNSVVAAIYTDNNHELDESELEQIKTISEWFDFIDTLLLSYPDTLNIEYENDLGFPSLISIDDDSIQDGSVHTQSNVQPVDLGDYGVNKALWNSKQLLNYEYTYRTSCFCLPNDTREKRIVVVNGEISSASYVDNGEAVEADLLAQLKTIDRLFGLIGNQLLDPPASMSIEYNAELGYPTRIDINYIEQVVDDAISYIISDLSHDISGT